MTRITTGELETVGKVASAAGFFVPTDDQKRLKAQFWTRWKMGPVRSTDEISAAAVVQLTDNSIAEAWWKDTAFREWFKNESSYVEEAEHNANLAIETLRQLMYADNPNIRLKAATESIKLKSELDKQAAAKEASDADISPEQLQKLVESAVAAGLVKLPGQ